MIAPCRTVLLLRLRFNTPVKPSGNDLLEMFPEPPVARLNNSGTVISQLLLSPLAPNPPMTFLPVRKVPKLVSNNQLVMALATTRLSATFKRLVFGLDLRLGGLALVVVVLLLRLVLDVNRPFFALAGMFRRQEPIQH